VFAIWQAICAFGEENLAEIDRLITTYFHAPTNTKPKQKDTAR
jgi:hypothetical protein